MFLYPILHFSHLSSLVLCFESSSKHLHKIMHGTNTRQRDSMNSNSFRMEIFLAFSGPNYVGSTYEGSIGGHI